MSVKIKFKKRLVEFFNRGLARNLILIFFLFIILIFFSILSESTDANISETSWWNISWGKRTIVSFNGTINQNWTQEFFFNKPSSMDENCNDIRWLDSAQTSELGHRNVVCNSSTVIEHVFLNDNDTIYLYYNNSDAVTTSKWRNAYQCGDDFEDNLFPNISAVNTPILSVADGILNVTYNGGSSTIGWLCLNYINYQNYIFYAAGMSNQNGYGQYFRWQADNNSYIIDRNAASGNIHYYPSGQAQAYVSSTGVWYNQTVVVNGTNYTSIINKVITASFLDTNGYTNSLTKVATYFSMDWTHSGVTDWYYVMPIMDVMPVVNYGRDTSYDATPPNIACPDDLFIECGSNQDNIGTATATDNIDPFPKITNNAPLLLPFGETVVTWTATDTAGNNASCQQQVTVRDAAPPLISCNPLINIIEGDSIPINYSVSDACSNKIDIAGNMPSQFPVGITMISWNATDNQGNTAACATLVNITSTKKGKGKKFCITLP